jgi:hypothetical protein
MKKYTTVLTFLVLFGLLFLPIEGRTQMGGGMMGGGSFGGQDHSGGGDGMNGGMMGGGSYGGQGYSGGGYGYGMWSGKTDPGYVSEPQYQQPHRSLDKKDARAALEDYLGSTRNPNLKLGKIEERKNDFEAVITTRDGSLVDRISVDRRTGRMRSLY